MPPSGFARTAGAALDPSYRAYYRDLRRKTVVRLVFTYLAPLLLLFLYFVTQYDAVVSEGQRLRLEAIAENQASTLDLFLSERIVNLGNAIDDPAFRQAEPDGDLLAALLGSLEKSSDAFVDLGYLDAAGVQIAYAGPFPALEERDYSHEEWFARLGTEPGRFVITDNYLGFRQRPHFTIAVRRSIRGADVTLRASLDPQRMYDWISARGVAGDVLTAVVNEAGRYQLVEAPLGQPLEDSRLVPPAAPGTGTVRVRQGGATHHHAFARLRTARWVVAVRLANPSGHWTSPVFWSRIVGVSALIIGVSLVIIFTRARRVVESQAESDSTRAQLEHAAKLASVGELAAGIAHEINNPLASINEEAGLMKDLIDPRFSRGENAERITCEEMIAYLDSIQESVYRCRDVTGKLLRFVRKTDMDLKRHDIHVLVDEVVDGLLGHEMSVSNVEIVRRYDRELPELVTDGHQLEQVLVNLINNAVDALGGRGGTITICTSRVGDEAHIAVSDTGAGIAPEHMSRLFMPFFTTKEVGKGTGLGLSVSYSIVKSHGGRVEVTSRQGRGSTFTIVLPIR